MMKTTAIVLAAGKGSRMKSNTPKQFIGVKGKPIIAYSLETFEKSSVDQIVLVTSEDNIDRCNSIVKNFNIEKCSDIVAGGSERALSVCNGLKKATGDYVLIHDGARPLVSSRIIKDTIEALKDHPAVVAVVPVKDTIRQIGENGELKDAIERSSLFGMQTPQAFWREKIIEAYDKLFKENADFSKITDDVMVLEKAFGIHAFPVDGEEMNRKITTPEDLAWLKSIV
ncbi:MAG: 2-C-methyl-D-erythritol 4-phosphate cytidylyltransferase [bacterium LCO1.1]|uniref:2-C-methyl-D-erythritol 4-phosphate cytidylyltransferase n=1 Tax=Candidatus Weimeria bifida TaxID=2599074 RepID=A0A6N7J0U6_9FIRM|nr:2-C-methyl-D-erythritol 4-phosphate cytidylyltransferase [Candidatus Weimeria bifida]